MTFIFPRLSSASKSFLPPSTLASSIASRLSTLVALSFTGLRRSSVPCIRGQGFSYTSLWRRIKTPSNIFSLSTALPFLPLAASTLRARLPCALSSGTFKAYRMQSHMQSERTYSRPRTALSPFERTKLFTLPFRPL